MGATVPNSLSPTTRHRSDWPLRPRVWVPLSDEAAAVRELLVMGWAVSPGERFRFNSSPGIRITTANLDPDDAERLADAIASLARSTGSTYSG